MAEGDRQAPYFRYGHDIVVPGKVGVQPKARQTAGAQRGLIGVFRGSLDAALRDCDGRRVSKKNTLRRWLQKTLAHERGYIFSGKKSNKYEQEMDDSRFCVIPRGNTPWTRRFFDAAVRGCIPAVLSDPVAFPYERLLDFTSMTVKLPEQWTELLATELSAVNISALEELQRALKSTWPAFVYTEGGCAYEMLLLELAARKHGFFERSPPATLNGATRFWSPARGNFVLPTARKVGPSWGAGAEPH